MKYINDALVVMKGDASAAHRRSVNNAAFKVLKENKNSLLGDQIFAWHDMPLRTRTSVLRDELHQRLPNARDFQVDGILANFYAESRFNTALQNGAVRPYEAIKSGSGAIGFAQWLSSGRFRALLTAGGKFAALKEQSPLLLSYLHPTAQVDTIMYELSSSHKKAFTSLLDSRNFEGAVAAWLRYYEGIVPSDISKYGSSYSAKHRIDEFKKIS